MKEYVPPFTITNKMITYISSIMMKMGKLDNYKNLSKMPILRKNNKIHSIHSSLKIENNSLSIKEVKDVINGKLVIGPEKEIQEVKNAYKAYEMIKKVNPYSVTDLKKVHGVMTNLLVDESGVFRSGEEGVFSGDICIFIAPKPEFVPKLMDDLFLWMKKNKDEIHPLILSSIFHYEFVFIHPFQDGNGRMARLWQNIILSNWKELFEYLPIETQIEKYQKKYYDAIQVCNNKGDCTIFIEFMLFMIDETLDKFLNDTELQVNHISKYVNKLLDVMEYDVPMSSNELMDKLNLKSKESFMKIYLKPALENGLIKMTYPNNPRCKNQTYYKEI